MPRYYVTNDAKQNGTHEVHKDDCVLLPDIKEKTDLGFHAICYTAILAAEKIYKQCDGCMCCSSACNVN